jgi:hypothetical protein
MRRWLGAALLAALAAPATASAHGIQGRADLPVPLIAFYWAAGVVLVVSFVVLAVAWKRPKLVRLDVTGAADAEAAPRHGTTKFLLGLVSFLLLLLTITTALFGSTDLNDNFAPIAVFVVWWIGIGLAAGFIGDVWRYLHPVAWLARLVRVPDRSSAWPRSRGAWVAVAGLLVFAWLELVYPTAANVRLLGALVLGWTLVTFAGMASYGVEGWLDVGEPFAVYTRVLARMAPRRHGRWRVPVVGLTHLRCDLPGMVVFVGLLIGTVSYDGLSRTLWWKRHLADGSVRLVDRTSLSATHAQQLFGTLGLAAMVLLALGAFALAALAARMIGGLPRRTRWGSTAQAFAPSLVPIALAYVVAHYFSYFWFQSQSIIRLASDPYGRGWDLFGTAGFSIDYTTLSANAIWAVQLGAIVVGHVLGLVLAHDRALEIEDEYHGNAVRSQWPMLALMVLYTVGGLYFLSEGLNA